MDHIKTKFCRIASLVLVISLGCAQISLGLAGSIAECVPGGGFPSVQSAPAQTHDCCCGEAESCCCDVRQGSAPALPDMAFTPVSGGAYDLTTRQIVLDGGVQPMQPPQVLKTTERWTGTGPPLILSYLVNVTFLC